MMQNDSSEIPPFISRLIVANIPPFTDEVDVNFSSAVNVLIGPNSTGKTTILKLLKSKGPGRKEESGRGSVNPLFSFKSRPRQGRALRTFTRKEIEASTIEDIPLIYIPATRVPLLERNYARAGYVEVRGEDLDRIKELDDASDSFNEFYARDVSRLTNAYFSDINDRASLERAYEVAERAFDCVKDVCLKPKIFSGDIVGHFVDYNAIPVEPNSQVKNNFIPVPEIHHLMGLYIVDNPNLETYVGDLSSGTQSLYVWVLYMTFRLATFYNWQYNWHEKPGVLLIDEIENHLHPNWQRRVIDALRSHFPNVQVFATTHSPFVVSGRQCGEVLMFSRNEEGKINIKEVEDDVFSWSADEILSEFMEVDYPTDLTTEQAVKIVLWLEDNGPLEGAAEEWRLAQIERLEAEERTTEAVDSEIIMLQWLRGDIKRPVELITPLEGDAEDWRLKIMEDLKAETGTDIFAGGAIAAQRELLERYSRLLREQDDIDDEEEEEYAQE